MKIKFLGQSGYIVKTEKTEIMTVLILKHTLGLSENKNVGLGLTI